MDQFITWGAIIAAAGSLVAVVKFWMDMGKAHAKAESAASQVAVMAAKHDLLSSTLSDFKVHVAQTYATTKALHETEQSLAEGLERSVQGIYLRLDQMTSRLDSLITIANKNHS